LPGSLLWLNEKAFLTQETSCRWYVRNVGGDRLGRTLVWPLRSQSARICRESCWHCWLRQSWTWPRGAVSSAMQCVAVSPPALSSGSESSPAGDNNEKSHYLFLLLHLTVKSNMSLFLSNVWERCLTESLWRKISEVILRAAFFRQRVSQSWIRGVGSSWPSWLSAFPARAPVNTNTAVNSGSLRAESNSLPQSQNTQDILWTVADQTL